MADVAMSFGKILEHKLFSMLQKVVERCGGDLRIERVVTGLPALFEGTKRSAKEKEKIGKAMEKSKSKIG